MSGRRAQPVPASPRARRAMARLGIDPSSVRGSGPGGRIVEADVLRIAAVAPAQAGHGAASAMRKAVAEATTRSFTTTPHFYLRAEADLAAFVKLRNELFGSAEPAPAARPTLTDLLLCALARALHECPFANCVWREGLVQLPGVDVGLVVAVGDGLLVPVLRDVGRAGLAAVSDRRARLAAAAQAGRLAASATGGGAASLSNLGPTRVDEFAAIILPGQSSMLAVGGAGPRPVAVGDRLYVRTTVRLCLSVDHRVMDGLAGARFLDRIVEFLENPAPLVTAT